MNPKFALALANEHLYSVPYKRVEKRWLDLYAMASVEQVEKEEAHEAIRILDRAIIVAGADVQEHIRKRQQGLSIERIPPAVTSLVTDDLVVATQWIPRTGTPRIERIAWPAMDKWTDANYLLSIAGPGRHVPVEVGRAYDEDGWTQRIIPFEAFLRRAWGGKGEAMYLAQYDLLQQIPELQRDISMPDMVWAGAGDPMINVWMGSGKGEIVTPPHTDPWTNCFVQVVGYKRVWIAPPETMMDRHEGYMSNTSSIPIFKEPIQVEGFEAVLAPGDMLVLPKGWWHAMRGEGDGPVCSVSIWF